MSGKSSKGKNQGAQSVPIEVSPGPCSEEEARQHLRAFIEAFVQRDSRSRFQYFLFDKFNPAKLWAGGDLHGLDSRYQTMLPSRDTFPDALAQRFGSTRGVYFTSDGECSKLTAAEAGSLYDEDAILSLEPGKTALVFNHEGYILALKR